MGTRRNSSGGLAPGLGPRCPGAESRPWRNSLRRSHRRSQPQHLLLVTWEGRNQEADRATFHLQPVQHGAAVHHVQHRPAGPQAGEDLEDKGGWGVRGCRDRLSLPVGARPSAHGSHRQRPLHPPLRVIRLQGLGHSGCPRDTGQTWERAQRAGIWGSGHRALAHLSPRVPAWPDNNSTFSRWVCTPPHKLPSPFTPYHEECLI